MTASPRTSGNWHEAAGFLHGGAHGSVKTSKMANQVGTRPFWTDTPCLVSAPAPRRVCGYTMAHTGNGCSKQSCLPLAGKCQPSCPAFKAAFQKLLPHLTSEKPFPPLPLTQLPKRHERLKGSFEKTANDPGFCSGSQCLPVDRLLARLLQQLIGFREMSTPKEAPIHGQRGGVGRL